jgi:hypothetical protein
LLGNRRFSAYQRTVGVGSSSILPRLRRVARSFNAASNRHQFVVIDASSGEIDILGEPVTLADFGIDPNSIQKGSSGPNAFTHDEIDAANQLFRQSAMHHLRRKNKSTAEREKKKEQAQMSKAVAQIQYGAPSPSANVRYSGNHKKNSRLLSFHTDASDAMSSASVSRASSTTLE